MKAIRRAALLLALPLALSACDSPFGIGSGLEGRYDLSGDVYGQPFHSVDGEIRVYDVRGSEARVDIRWFLRDEDGRVILSIDSDTPAWADIYRDEIDFTFEGEFVDDRGYRYSFLLDHWGVVQGRTMIGDWELTSELGSESGEFRATR